MTELPIIAFVASPLQLASFRLSARYRDDALIVGHRGMRGDLRFEGPILNDAEFLAQLDDIIGNRNVEVFLPNSVTGLFFACACHPRIKRMSYLDEGRLTWRFLEEHHRKPRHPASVVLRSLFTIAQRAPRRLRTTLYRVLCALLKRTFTSAFIKDPESYPYQTIDRHWKPGAIICHAPVSTTAADVEIVDLFQALDFPVDYSDAACIFLHPGQIPTEAESSRIVQRILALGLGITRVLVRPHPLFSTFSTRLDAFRAILERAGIAYQEPELSEQQEVAIELYARGVRVFILTSDSTIGDTARFFPSFFKDLRLVHI